ncbi:NHLP-related RiPP peptide [Stenotrophomonas maltophilia]|uniref:NHLP-related RiPP peptide n=1 Tax=Stenotrophomonas riyadhensis TaxID=2859893 RepID=A0ABT2XG50_9GAMM|nr:NHLP-related RiPP peptide [Stenotrophomonas sp. CFS3442]MBH1618529.1 NHLP-related RiPP peptide [Stenotrophomonas maltophilia]MCV0324909.1 NHLP-related RiPP peptide [Stenotrophomonas sp. CFS3442]HEL4246272.1 NHLP-related RiPP peptide [Stenotrophomonas maltophilia]
MSTKKKPLSPADALKLLDLLTSNESFRLAFQANPAAALVQISTDAAEASAECLMPGKLADASTLAAARDQLLEQFTTRAMFSLPHCFIDNGPSPTP